MDGLEDRGQGGPAQEVPQGGQVGDGGVVGVLGDQSPLMTRFVFVIKLTSPLLHI